MKFGLRQLFLAVSIVAVVFFAVHANLENRRLKAFYANCVNKNMPESGVHVEYLTHNAILIRVSPGHITHLRTTLKHKDSGEVEVLRESTLGEGIYATSLVFDPSERTFGYCVDRKVYVTHVPDTFQSGGMGRFGAREPMQWHGFWCSISKGFQSTLRFELMWNEVD